MSTRNFTTVRVTTASFPETVIHSPVPVLVEFLAPRCATSQTLEAVLEELAESHGDNLRVARVDTEECPELPRVFGVRTVPALILFQNGYPLEMRAGAQTRRELEEWINALLFQAAPD